VSEPNYDIAGEQSIWYASESVRCVK
jgi:hypothetical protein